MRKNVYIDPYCMVTSLIPSVIEEYHKEVSGYLIGSNGSRSRRLRVAAAYPLQSDIKKPSCVTHGNLSAVERIDGVMKSMCMRLIGGFHSHPQGPSCPSSSDIEFVEERMEERSLHAWLELIASVRKREYRTAHQTGWTLRHFENKLGLTITTDPWTGFAVSLAGYWILSGRKGVKEARLWTSKRQNF